MKVALIASFLFSSFAFANITVTGPAAKAIWNSAKTVGQIENVDIIQKYDNKEGLYLDTISCVFEQYNACTFYANTEAARSFVISYDGSYKFMASLQDAGVAPDFDNSRIDADAVSCEKENENYTCDIVEYIRPL